MGILEILGLVLIIFLVIVAFILVTTLAKTTANAITKTPLSIKEKLQIVFTAKGRLAFKIAKASNKTSTLQLKENKVAKAKRVNSQKLSQLNSDFEIYKV